MNAAKPSTEEAKRRLVEEVPTPADFLPPRLDFIRKHPREAVAIGAMLGVVIGASPKLRKLVLDVGVAAVRALIK